MEIKLISKNIMKRISNIVRDAVLYNKFDNRSNDYFIKVSNRYKQAMADANYNNNLNEYESRDHLIWMLNEIVLNDQMSITKKHRWLGYIQGILCARGIINVKTERDATRNIFNGD